MICLKCGQRVGQEPSARDAAARVMAEAKEKITQEIFVSGDDVARHGLGPSEWRAVQGVIQPLVEEAIQRATDELRKERTMTLGLATKLLPLHGVPCWIAGVAKGVTVLHGVHKHEYRFAIRVDLPTGQVSWPIHDSDLGAFGHLVPNDDGWLGVTDSEETRQSVEAYSRSFAVKVPPMF